MRRALLSLLAAGVGGCASAPPPVVVYAPPPAAAVDGLAAIVEAPRLAGAQWGILAVDLASGDTLLARDAARRFIPASTMKLATAVAALDLLGPDHRWRTDLWTSGPVPSTTGTLEGDLVVPGTGDPSLSERWWPDVDDPIAILAAGPRENGIVRVTGALVIDASRWDSTSVLPSWEVGDLPFADGATGGAFAIAEGATHVEVRGGSAAGDAVSISWWPVGTEGFVRSRLTTDDGAAPDVTAAYLPESRVLELTGTVPVRVVDTLAFATRDAVRQAAAALHRALVARGVRIDGGWRVEWEPGVRFGDGCTTGFTAPCPDGRVLQGLASPVLTELVAGMLGPSQNWIAEQLLRTLGERDIGRGGWDEGTSTVGAHLAQVVGIDPTDFRLVDGSGLSVQNLLTPRALVQLLRHADTRPWALPFRSALAEPGEPETTLSDRMPDLAGRVFAKTGTLTNVASLAGYLTDARGREVAFAILVNGANVPAARVREAIDDVVRLLAAGR